MPAFSLAHPTVLALPPPGEGGIDVRGILGHLPPGIPVAPEGPMTALAAEAVARRAREAAVRLLGGDGGAG